MQNQVWKSSTKYFEYAGVVGQPHQRSNSFVTGGRYLTSTASKSIIWYKDSFAWIIDVLNINIPVRQFNICNRPSHRKVISSASRLITTAQKTALQKTSCKETSWSVGQTVHCQLLHCIQHTCTKTSCCTSHTPHSASGHQCRPHTAHSKWFPGLRT